MWSACLAAIVTTAGVWALGAATDGFRAFTTESARRLAVERSPRPLPDATLTSHTGESFRWEDLRGAPILVEFIYTTCPDVCQRMTSDLASLAHAEMGARPENSVRLLSVSFDRENDTLEQLRRVAKHFGADGERWRFARIEQPTELARTLEVFGVVVIANPPFGFEHNAAIHGVDGTGRLRRVADVSDAEEMVRWARELR